MLATWQRNFGFVKIWKQQTIGNMMTSERMHLIVQVVDFLSLQLVVTIFYQMLSFILSKFFEMIKKWYCIQNTDALLKMGLYFDGLIG